MWNVDVHSSKSSFLSFLVILKTYFATDIKSHRSSIYNSIDYKFFFAKITLRYARYIGGKFRRGFIPFVLREKFFSISFDTLTYHLLYQGIRFGLYPLFVLFLFKSCSPLKSSNLLRRFKLHFTMQLMVMFLFIPFLRGNSRILLSNPK